MLGAIIGDIVGSRFEWNNIKNNKTTEEYEAYIILTAAMVDLSLSG